jgi:polar amino acid transport system permease protein
MDFELSLFLQSLPALAKGAVVTAELTVISILIGALVGTVVGVARVSGRVALEWLAAGYVTLMRGVPLLVTLLFLYYGLPSVGVRLDAFTVAIIALSITSGAYIGEIVRAGIQSIDPGQMRAARSLGMSWAGAMRRIILPQAMRRVLPPLTNEALTLLKNTSLVSTIALADLLRAGLEVMTWQANTFTPVRRGRPVLSAPDVAPGLAQHQARATLPHSLKESDAAVPRPSDHRRSRSSLRGRHRRARRHSDRRRPHCGAGATSYHIASRCSRLHRRILRTADARPRQRSHPFPGKPGTRPLRAHPSAGMA